MPKMKYGLSGDPGDIESEGYYDGPCPPKGRYAWRLSRLILKENSSGDLMLSGLLILDDPRPSRSRWNGYPMWFNRNLTDKSAKFVKNFIQDGLRVPLRDMAALDNLIILDQTKDLPANVVSVGKIKLDKQPHLVVAARRRRDSEDPQLETDDWAPAFWAIDPADLAESDEDADEDYGDEGEDEGDAEDPFDDESEDGDEPDDDEPDGDDDEGEDGEDLLTEDELRQMGIAELRALLVDEEIMTKAQAARIKQKSALVAAYLKAYDEPEDEEPEDEPEDEEPPPPPRRTARKSTAAKAARPARTRR